MYAATDDANLTALLRSWNEGNAPALEQLTLIVYAELHRLARIRMARERPGHTIHPSALVNEAFIRFMEAAPGTWRDRSHFFSFMSRVMRQILVDLARTHRSVKRGNGNPPLALVLAENIGLDPQFPDFVDLDRALNELAQLDERQARVVELRYFGGLEYAEIGKVLSTSDDTARRDWNCARAWLFQRLRLEAVN